MNVFKSILGRRGSMASMWTGAYTERAGGSDRKKNAGRLCKHCDPGWRTQHLVFEGSSEPPRLRSSKIERLCAVYLQLRWLHENGCDAMSILKLCTMRDEYHGSNACRSVTRPDIMKSATLRMAAVGTPAKNKSI
jgi:hypothetical protein